MRKSLIHPTAWKMNSKKLRKVLSRHPFERRATLLRVAYHTAKHNVRGECRPALANGPGGRKHAHGLRGAKQGHTPSHRTAEPLAPSGGGGRRTDPARAAFDHGALLYRTVRRVVWARREPHLPGRQAALGETKRQGAR